MKKPTSDWKDRLGVVYSTNPDFSYSTPEQSEKDTLTAGKQDLRISLDKKHRQGKEVTLISGFIGRDDDLKNLGKFLKNKCGTGGTVKDGEILIQGDFCNKVMEILKKEGYRVKRSGG